MGSSESVDGVIANRQIPWCGCSSSFKLIAVIQPTRQSKEESGFVRYLIRYDNMELRFYVYVLIPT